MGIGIDKILDENREPINISIQWEKDLINDAGTTEYQFEKITTETHTKINPRWIGDLIPKQ